MSEGEVSESQILEAIGKMDKRKLRALIADPRPAPATGHKMSPVLEAIPLDEINHVGTELDELCAELDRKGDGYADQITNGKRALDLSELPPDLVQVMQSNSSFRGKGLAHSLRVAKRWIDEKHGPAPKR